jgi:hypothetical protein
MTTKNTRTNTTDETPTERRQREDTRHAGDALADTGDADHDAAIHELYETLVEQIGRLRETYAVLDSYHVVESMPLLTAALHLLDDVEGTVQAALDPEDDSE